MIVKAVQKIPAQSELTISYVPGDYSLKKRQTSLAQKNIKCNCRRCVDEQPDLKVDVDGMKEKLYEFLRKMNTMDPHKGMKELAKMVTEHAKLKNPASLSIIVNCLYNSKPSEEFAQKLLDCCIKLPMSHQRILIEIRMIEWLPNKSSTLAKEVVRRAKEDFEILYGDSTLMMEMLKHNDNHNTFW